MGENTVSHFNSLFRQATDVSWTVLLVLYPAALVYGQAPGAWQPSSSEPADTFQASQATATPASELNAQPEPQTEVPAPSLGTDQRSKEPQASEGKQTDRILWVVPNFAAVSTNTQLPPLTAKQKFILATHESVDYYSFIWTGVLAGQALALKSDPGASVFFLAGVR